MNPYLKDNKTHYVVNLVKPLYKLSCHVTGMDVFDKFKTSERNMLGEMCIS